MNTVTFIPKAHWRLTGRRVQRAIAHVGHVEASRLLDITPRCVSSICEGKTPVSAFIAVRLQEHFGVDAHKLLIDQTIADLERERAEYRKRAAA